MRCDDLPRYGHVGECRRQQPRIVEVFDEGVGDALLRRMIFAFAVAAVLRDQQLLRRRGDRLEQQIAEAAGVARVRREEVVERRRDPVRVEGAVAARDDAARRDGAPA